MIVKIIKTICYSIRLFREKVFQARYVVYGPHDYIQKFKLDRDDLTLEEYEQISSRKVKHYNNHYGHWISVPSYDKIKSIFVVMGDNGKYDVEKMTKNHRYYLPSEKYAWYPLDIATELKRIWRRKPKKRFPRYDENV